MEFIVLLAVGYFLGSVPTAYIAAKWYRGIDIRKYGSGNVGGSNLFRIVPRRIAIPAFLFDIFKGVLPVIIAGRLGLSFSEQAFIGVAAIVGHNWPIFLGFNGGRGIATTGGILLVITPILALFSLAGIFISTIFHQMALFTLVIIGFFPFVIFYSDNSFASFLVGRSLTPEERLMATIAFILIFIFMVIRRITAPKSSLAGKMELFELYRNRLLWDRDIRNRQAWISQNINQQNELDDNSNDE
jgi:acyl phosphate:glycerol-3-phosphate acyltransferase